MSTLTRLQKIPFAEMRTAPVLGALVCLLLTACSSAEISQTLAPAYTPPSPPTQAGIMSGVKTAAAEEKLTGPLEVSAVRPNDHSLLGSYFACLRVANPSAAKRPTYSVFWDGDTYKGSRLSAIVEACETQAYTPVDLTPPAPPPKPAPKRKR